MSIVHARALRRTFHVAAHRPGLLGALRGLVSRDGRVVEAVADVTLDIEAGDFVGVVGSNGAGKSTTLKMATGILVPTSGELSVCGHVPHRERSALARRIGVVFGQRTQLWWDLPPSEGFDLLRRIYAIEAPDYRRRLDELVDRLILGEVLDVPVRKLSLGQKMRCELAAAMLHDPAVLFLDEPTIGLDVLVKDQLHAFLRAVNAERGTTILLTSHDLDDIQRLCRRVVVIDRGRVLHDGDLSSLKTRYGHRRRLTVTLGDTPAAALSLPEGAAVVEQQGKRLVVEFDADALRAPDLVRALLRDHDVVDLTVHEAGIEEVVKRLYREGW